jgi:hypothetical protein
MKGEMIMAQLPCILCSKIIEAKFGGNTIYYSRDGKNYALCSKGCTNMGADDTSVVYAKIAKKTDEEKARSLVPPSDRG